MFAFFTRRDPNIYPAKNTLYAVTDISKFANAVFSSRTANALRERAESEPEQLLFVTCTHYKSGKPFFKTDKTGDQSIAIELNHTPAQKPFADYGLIRADTLALE